MKLFHKFSRHSRLFRDSYIPSILDSLWSSCFIENSLSMIFGINVKHYFRKLTQKQRRIAYSKQRRCLLYIGSQARRFGFSRAAWNEKSCRILEDSLLTSFKAAFWTLGEFCRVRLEELPLEWHRNQVIRKIPSPRNTYSNFVQCL